MTTTATRPAAAIRATDLTTKRATARYYFSSGSPRVLVTAAVALIVLRVLLGGWGRGDIIVLTVTLAIAGSVEWIIHKYLLHAGPDSWQSRILGTGIGHQQHHVDPPALEWLLLRGVDAGQYLPVFGIFTAIWTLPILWITGSDLIGPFLTGYVLAVLGLAHYEWTHLLVHTRYRPRTRYYARLARTHRLHHYRNERYWLGVTSNSGDRLLRTYPQQKTDVALSDTARTLVSPSPD